MSATVHLAYRAAPREPWCATCHHVAMTGLIAEATCLECLKAAAVYGDGCRERIKHLEAQSRISAVDVSRHADPTCDLLSGEVDAVCTCNAGDEVKSTPTRSAEEREASRKWQQSMAATDRMKAAYRRGIVMGRALVAVERRERGELTEDERKVVEVAEKHIAHTRVLSDEQWLAENPRFDIPDGPG